MVINPPKSMKIHKVKSKEERLKAFCDLREKAPDINADNMYVCMDKTLLETTHLNFRNLKEHVALDRTSWSIKSV